MRPRHSCLPLSAWLCALLMLCFSSRSLAQVKKATISGQVMDESGAVLAGAQVQLDPQGMSLVANQLGEFVITDVAPGDYTLTVSYVGFASFKTDFKLTADQTKHLDIKLMLASVGESVIVTAEGPHSETEAINLTLDASNLVDILPADVIAALPNANVADALGRMPSVALQRTEGEGQYIEVRGTEPRLTNVTIDGISVPSPEPDVRQVRLDVIPADLVESVEINKTLMPNIDGDGIGGSVDFKTKEAGEFPTVSVFGVGGYNPILGGRENTQGGGTIGHRFGPKKKIGLLFGGAFDYNGRGIDNYQPSIDPNSTFAAPYYDNNTIREYRYYRNRWGYAGTADYKLGDFSSIYFKGLYSNLQDYGDKWYYEPQAAKNPKFYTSSKRPDASVSSYLLGGHHQFTASLLTWELSAARSYETDSAGNPKADFGWIGPSLVCGYDPTAQTNPYIPHFGNGCDGPNSPLQNASDWGFKDITTSTGLTAQLNLTAAASYARNYHVGSHFATFEVGAKIRNDHKYQDATENVYDGWKSSNYPMTMFLSNFNNTNFLNGWYFGGHYGPVSNFNTLQSYTLQNLTSYLDGYNTAANTYPNQFDIVERISAGYVMNTMDFGKLHTVIGVRFEGTQMNTLGYNVTLYPAGSTQCINPTGCGAPVPVNDNPTYIDILPTVSLKYSFSKSDALRAVFARGVSRPDAYQLVPYVVEDDSTNPPTIDIGNPSLKPEHANNYDLLYEHYLNPAGLIQGGLFYKQISGTLITTSYTANSGPYVGDLVSQWLNVSNAILYGVELSYQQRLSMLPGALGGLGIYANYSWTGSRVTAIPGRSDQPALQAQTPNVWNLMPSYDRGPLSLRVGLSYNGPSIYQYEYQTASDPVNLGPRGPNGDVYVYPHLQLDAQGTVRLGHGLSAMVNGLNLTNEVFGYYQGSPIFVNQREWYKTTVSAGIRYTLNHEK
jgi:TonB-dependent receptor